MHFPYDVLQFVCHSICLLFPLEWVDLSLDYLSFGFFSRLYPEGRLLGLVFIDIEEVYPGLFDLLCLESVSFLGWTDWVGTLNRTGIDLNTVQVGYSSGAS